MALARTILGMVSSYTYRHDFLWRSSRANHSVFNSCLEKFVTPWHQQESWQRNWRFIIIMIYMTIVAFACAYGIKKATDATTANTDLINRIVVVGKEADYKLCLSVRQGKIDRIKEYKFTLARTVSFYNSNPQVPRDTLKITEDFYHDLIQRTKDSIVPCPPPPESIK